MGRKYSYKRIQQLHQAGCKPVRLMGSDDLQRLFSQMSDMQESLYGVVKMVEQFWNKRSETQYLVFGGADAHKRGTSAQLWHPQVGDRAAVTSIGSFADVRVLIRTGPARKQQAV